MTFTLEVRITGICLFVPQPKSDPPRVSVLMPNTSGHEDHGIEQHRTVLVHDRMFAASECSESQGNWCLHELSDFALLLANGSTPHVSIPGVYQLNRPGCDRKANPNAGPAAGVVTKILLESGYCEHVPPGARFFVDGAVTRMPYEVRWVIPDMVHSTLPLRSLRPGVPDKSIALHVHQDDRVVLYARCIPASELWPDSPHSEPDKAMLVNHFRALDQLLVPGHDPIDLPQWQHSPGDKPFERSRDYVGPAEARGNPYTCMPGQTDPDEGP